MNIQQFLEEENERFYAEPVRELHLKEENADGSFSEQAYMHNWIKDHDTRLINKVLDECIKVVMTHEEGEDLGYCDTGADMELGCRSECVEMAVNRLNQLKLK